MGTILLKAMKLIGLIDVSESAPIRSNGSNVTFQKGIWSKIGFKVDKRRIILRDVWSVHGLLWIRETLIDYSMWLMYFI